MKNVMKTLCVLAVAGSASAAITWDGGATDSYWGSATNWSSDAVPSATDDVQNFAANAETVLKTTQTVASFASRNSTLTIEETGNLTVAGTLKLAQGGSLDRHNLIVSGTLSANSFQFQTAGSSDTKATFQVNEGASVTFGSFKQSQNHGSLDYIQSGGSVAINGAFAIGTVSSTTANDYDVTFSGASTLSYATAALGTDSVTAKTIISLSGSDYEITADTSTDLGESSQMTFAFDENGIGTWDAAALTLDSTDIVVDLTDADLSGESEVFQLIAFDTITGFDADKFSFLGADSVDASVYVGEDGIYVSVPEPATFGLIGMGACLTFLIRKRLRG